MKPILFSVQDAHSTAFTRGIDSHMEVEGMHFVQTAYDPQHTNILIQDGLASYLSNGLQVYGSKAILRHFRYDKSVYNNYFNEVAAKHELGLYRPVKCYPTSFSIPEIQPVGMGVEYVLRPKVGARGLGFIEFPYPKTTTNAVDTLVGKWCKEEITDEYFFEVLKKIGGKMSESPNTKTSEVKDCLKSGYDFVKVVRDVDVEYRIITDSTGAPSIVVERERLDYGLKIRQASGGYQNTDKIISLEHFYSQLEAKSQRAEMGNQIKKFFENVMFPVHSFDLFITANSNWGFFEACSQFGCTTVPDGFVRKETGKMLAYIGKQLSL